MPLEIRELVIKASIDNDKKSGTTGSADNNSNGETRKQIINQCVEKVLEILKDRKER